MTWESLYGRTFRSTVNGHEYGVVRAEDGAGNAAWSLAGRSPDGGASFLVGGGPESLARAVSDGVLVEETPGDAPRGLRTD